MDWMIRGSYHGRGKNFILSQRPEKFWGPNIFLFSIYRGSFPEVIVPEYEVDTSSVSGAEVRN
jgi:hypothetical protein